MLNCNIILLYILCKLQLQQTHNTMASKPSLNTSIFIGREHTAKPSTSHGNSDVATTSAHSYVVLKYVTDVATLIATTPESRKMFLTEVTKVCLEAAKKDKAEADQAAASPMVQTPTNTNTTGTKTIYSTSTYGNPTTKPVTPMYNTSGTWMKKRVEEGKPAQIATLFAPTGVAEDLSKTQYLLCGEIKEELKVLKETIAKIPFQDLSKQIQELSRNLEIRMCSLELSYKTLKDIIFSKNQSTVPTGFISSVEMEPIRNCIEV